MTLHDKLKEILPDVPPSTIAAIIQAVKERLPGAVHDIMPYINGEFMPGQKRRGWNAYREEVRKVLGEKL